ncbi:unnamed protein product [Prunus armeniaca]
MEKAYWHKYSKSSSYNTPWLLANGWENGSNNIVFTLDMLEKHHLGASFGRQDYQETTVISANHSLISWVMSRMQVKQQLWLC